MDMIGPLPTTSDGYRYILCIMDRFSHYITLAPLKTQTTKETMMAFKEYWIDKFGVPEILLTDNGTNFRSELAAYANQLLGVKQSFTTQSNGMNERVHRFIKE